MKNKKLPLIFLAALLMVIGMAAEAIFGNAFFVLTLLPCLLSILFFFKVIKLNPGSKYGTLLALAPFLFIGSMLFNLRKINEENTLASFVNAKTEIDATLISSPVKTEKGFKMRIGNIRISNTGEAVEGNSILFSKVNPGLKVYDKVHVTGKVAELKNEYKAMLERKDIFSMFFAKEITKTGEEKNFNATLTSARNNMAEKIYACMEDSSVAGLTIAMLLGDRSGVDEETNKNFSAAGVSHIISISGLHILILFGFLSTIASRISNKNWMKVLSGIIIILILFAYAFFSGGFPPVLRAVVMITLVVIARLASLRVSPLAILGFCSMVFLSIDPYLIFDIGFQLSFVAVAGIVLLLPIVSLKLKNNFTYIPKKIREGLAVSLAAQLFTLPFILFHFGVFPTYFLLANLIVLPFADLALKISFVGIIFIFIHPIGVFIFKFVDLLIWICQCICSWIANLPGAVTKDFSIHDKGVQIMLLFGIALCVPFMVRLVKHKLLTQKFVLAWMEIRRTAQG